MVNCTGFILYNLGHNLFRVTTLNGLHVQHWRWVCLTLKTNTDFFPTEQMPVKCHIYVERKNKIIVNILEYFRNDRGKFDSLKDEKNEYIKLRQMGTAVGSNIIEPGINNVVVLVAENNGELDVKEAFLDGDRMVI